MSVLNPHAAAAHLPRLNRLAYALCGSRQLAEDITQETYLRILARPRRLRTGSEYPYLARTLRNVLHDHRRSERPAPSLAGEDQLEDLPQVRTDGDPLAALPATSTTRSPSRGPARPRLRRARGLRASARAPAAWARCCQRQSTPSRAAWPSAIVKRFS